MRRFLVDAPLLPGQSITLSAEESRHASRALRLSEGDEILITDGKGTEAAARILSTADYVTAEITRVSKVECAVSLELLQAPLKGPKMDWLVEKLTEIGVTVVHLAATQHTVASGEKVDRWHRIAQAAVKQSGNPRIPTIHPIRPFPDALHALGDCLRVHLQPGAPRGLAEVVKEGVKNGAVRIVLAVGPEGGFSPVEEKLLQEAGFACAALSRQVLRGETASVAALAIAAHSIDF